MHPITLTTASQSDFEELVAIRIDAMRESLERLGRFDPARARERFAAAFVPEQTRFIEVHGKRVGFVVTKPRPDHLLLDHLYIMPGQQGAGIGSQVLLRVFEEAQSLGLGVKVGALKQSDSNRFYQRHGFVLVEQGEFDNYYVRPVRAQSADMG